jgi:DNA-binding response OmpR family regulator
VTGPVAILVVDDEPDLAATCQRLLRRRGYEVSTAASCREGLAALAGPPPALLISDIHLPDGNGLTLVRAARALSSPPVVIVMTAFADEPGRRAAMEAGAAAYVAKPFSTQALTTLVDDLLATPPDAAVPGT